MNKKRKRKFILTSIILFLIACIVGLVLYAFRQGINLYYTPTQLRLTAITPMKIRLGGYVKSGTVFFTTLQGKQIVHFILTDHQTDIAITYQGLLPALFREEQGIVVTGYLLSRTQFQATEVLAKHDERYRPPLTPTG